MKNHNRYLFALTLFFVFLTAIMLSKVPIVSAENQTYSDISPQHPAYPYVTFLSQRDIIKGFEDGTFRPDKGISRAEMVSILVRAAGLENNLVEPANNSFNDVSANHWAYKNIETATKAGLVKGYSDGSFKPEAQVTRAETCAFLLRLNNEALPQVAIPAAVKDVGSDFWAKPQIAVAIDSGMINLANDTDFLPNTAANRFEVCRGMTVLLNISPDKARIELSGTLVPIRGEVFFDKGDGSLVKISVATSCKAGTSVKTASKSEAEIRFPDGSGLKLDENTEIRIINSNGWSNITRSGQAESMVDYVEIKLIKGRMFGILATNYLNQEKNDSTFKAKASDFINDRNLIAALDLPVDILLAAQEGSQSDAPWYKQQYAKKVRVKVDMPFGVAAIRGTIWMNEVSKDKQTTSVADGVVEVSSAGQSQNAPAGMSVEQRSGQVPPPEATFMTQEQRQLWTGVHSWVAERAKAIEEAFPLITQSGLNLSIAGVAQGIIESVEQAAKGTSSQPVNETNNQSGGSSSGTTLTLNTSYGPATGVQTLNRNVNVAVPGITLRNLIINGDLLLAEGIGEGDIILENVTVNGNTVIRGGGPNSIRLVNCTFATITINKENNLLRLVAEGSTSITAVNLNSGAKLAGNFNIVRVMAKDITVEIQQNSNIQTINVGQQLEGINIALANGVVVQILQINSPTAISGLGEIGQAFLNANNINIEMIPAETTVATGFTAMVGGRTLQAGFYTALQILQTLQAMISSGLNTQAAIDAARLALEEARIAINYLDDGDEKNELLAVLENYQTAINQAQTALVSVQDDDSGSWILVKSYPQALTSDFSMDVTGVEGATHYALYALYNQNSIQIDSRKLLNEKIRGLSIVFSQLGNLQVRFYNSADANEALASAGLIGTYANGEGLGIMQF